MLRRLIQKEEKENRKEGGISMKWVEQLATGMRSKRARGYLDRSEYISSWLSCLPFLHTQWLIRKQAKIGDLLQSEFKSLYSIPSFINTCSTLSHDSLVEFSGNVLATFSLSVVVGVDDLFTIV